MGKSKWTTARRRALERAGGLCQVRINDICETDAVQVHHRLRRSHGGGNADSNLLATCNPCHVWIHKHGQQAVEMGLLVNGTTCDRCKRPSPAHLCSKCISEVRTARHRLLDENGRWIVVDVLDEFDWPA